MDNTLYMIGNTHFDPVWLWTWDEAMASVRSTFRSALDRMREDGDFIYSFCTPPVFRWIEEVDPGLFAEIKARVEEGRWDVRCEGWYLQSDCNAPMGESLVRQGIYGQRYLYDTFGIYATTVFNIDSFGHSAMLPQIMSKCALRYYVFSRPNGSEKELPDALFRWQSRDGSSVLAYRSGGQVGGAGYSTDVGASIDEFQARVQTAGHDSMLVYGVSNHGGAPTRKALATIQARRQAARGYAIRFGSTTDFFKAQEDKTLPTVQEELQTRFYGVFSNYPEIKRNNRIAEYAALNAERMAAWVNRLFGKPYPAAALDGVWEDILFNQFHDILGGACIRNAYFDARNLHGRAIQSANETLHKSAQYLARHIRMLGNNRDSVWNLVVFNLNGTDYRGVLEAEVQWAWEFPWYRGGIELVDGDGRIYPAQIIQEYSVIPEFRTRFAFAAEIPCMGYKVFAVRQTYGEVAHAFTPESIAPPFIPVALADAGDTWCFNTRDGYGAALEAFEPVDSRVVEQGCAFTTIKNVMRFRSSIFEEYITRYQALPYIDYRYRVNWNEKHIVLKLMATRPCNKEILHVGAPYACVPRRLDGMEYPLSDMMTCGDDADGFTLLADGIFAYDTDMASGAVRLTLLRSAVHGDLRRNKPLSDAADYAYLGQGVHEGRVRWIPRGMAQARAMAQAMHFINKPLVIDEANHPGSMPPSCGFLSADAGHTVVSVLKMADDREGIIIRMAEYDGMGERFTLSVDGLGEYAVSMQPFEIKTLRIDRDGAREVNMLEQNPLPA